MGGTSPQYRPEIDGLRALAVVSVILFHTNLGVAPGGYVGVDIFFVISGYLISSIILREIAQDRFTFVGFYERRIRRIFPALFVMLVGAGLMSALILPPDHFKTFSQSLVATTAFASNLFFWLKSGYFGGDAELSPLIHMWSLSVEEQFYVVFPFVAILCRFGKKWMLDIAFVAILVVSLALCVHFTRTHQLAAFFLTPMRAWELMFGAVVAVREETLRAVLAGTPIRRTVAQIAAALLVTVPLFAFDNATAFPGWAAVAPVAGAALLIVVAQPGTWTGRLLSASPVVFVGLLSYSAYLWHQPLYALARMRGLAEFGWPSYAVLIALTFLLAWLSWRFVERPFRNRSNFTVRQIYAGFFVGSALLIGVGVAGHLGGGLPQRFSAETLAVAATGAPSPRRDACHSDGPSGIQPEEACRYLVEADVRWAVLGDSHGVELAYALAEQLKFQGQGVLHLTSSGCPPALTFQAHVPGCSDWTRRAVAVVVADPKITDVLLVYRHSFYLSGDQTRTYPAVPNKRPMFLGELPADEARQRYAESLEALVQRLTAAGKRVHLLAPVPDLPTHVERYTFIGDPNDARRHTGASMAFYEARNAFILPVLRGLATRPGVDLIEPTRALCGNGRCASLIEGRSMYFDDNHLSVTGAERVLRTASGQLGLPEPEAADAR